MPAHERSHELRAIHALREHLDRRLDHIEALIKGPVHHPPPKPGPAASMRFAIGGTATKDQPEVHMAFSMKDSDPPASATVEFKDAEGNATTPDDVPVWASSDETVVKVTAADDGLSASVAAGVPGTGTVSVQSTDADGTVLNGSADVEVTPGEAASVDITITPGA